MPTYVYNRSFKMWMKGQTSTSGQLATLGRSETGRSKKEFKLYQKYIQTHDLNYETQDTFKNIY